MDIEKEALELHEKHKGKLEIKSKVKLEDRKDLSLAYTPGVASPCLKIAAAEAIASCGEAISREKIVPPVLDKNVALRVAEAVKKAWMARK